MQDIKEFIAQQVAIDATIQAETTHKNEMVAQAVKENCLLQHGDKLMQVPEEIRPYFVGFADDDEFWLLFELPECVRFWVYPLPVKSANKYSVGLWAELNTITLYSNDLSGIIALANKVWLNRIANKAAKDASDASPQNYSQMAKKGLSNMNQFDSATIVAALLAINESLEKMAALNCPTATQTKGSRITTISDLTNDNLELKMFKDFVTLESDLGDGENHRFIFTMDKLPELESFCQTVIDACRDLRSRPESNEAY